METKAKKRALEVAEDRIWISVPSFAHRVGIRPSAAPTRIWLTWKVWGLSFRGWDGQARFSNHGPGHRASAMATFAEWLADLAARVGPIRLPTPKKYEVRQACIPSQISCIILGVTVCLSNLMLRSSHGFV